MNKRLLLIAAGSLLAMWLLAAGVVVAYVAEFGLDWNVVATGGGHAASADYVLDGTLGQPAAGGASNDDYQLGTGYWGDTAPPTLATEHRIHLPLVLR
jgi:hypothetical protein